MNRKQTLITIINRSEFDIDESAILDFTKFIYKKMEIDNNKELNILFDNNEKLRQLNFTYRKKNRPTDVLSFYGYDGNILGDIAISTDAAISDSKKISKDVNEHILFLVAHGCLHLLGFEHETVDEYNKMVALQENLLREWKYEIGEK